MDWRWAIDSGRAPVGVGVARSGIWLWTEDRLGGRGGTEGMDFPPCPSPTPNQFIDPNFKSSLFNFFF